MTTLANALELHTTAVEELVSTAETVPGDKWREPLGGGKWSPAEVVDHLVCTYDTLIDELAGGAGMKIRTSFWQRVLLRRIVVPRLLAGGPFPEGAVAPRETRPDQGVDQGVGVSVFRERATAFEVSARASGPKQQLTHAYFGAASVANGVLLCARHIQHHCAQLKNS